MSAVAKPSIDEAVWKAVLESCRMDVMAMKPGNVSVYAQGHGMTADDFLRSAARIVPVMAARGVSVGERILRSVEVTREAVACNTNLGIILLAAPLVHAVLGPLRREDGLRQRLAVVLKTLDRRDAELVFEAIRLAGPGGLGHSEHHDVRSAPTVSLVEAMTAAQGWDRIAYQYAHEFEDVFAVGVPTIRHFAAAWEGLEQGLRWPTVACYLSFLARIPDSHIQRKFGKDTAEHVRHMAERVETSLKACENPINAMPMLQEFDKTLKRGGLNPGTSADLTVASLLAFHLDHLLAGSGRAVSMP